MTLQVTAGGQQLSSDFKAAAQAGNVTDAFNLLQGLSLTDGLISIQGGNYRDKDNNLTTTDSTHVGIVIKVEGDTWHTIEGGASDHITRRHARQVVAVPGDRKAALKYGKWTFQDDIGLTSADSDRTRPLQGWFDISKIGDQQWMAGT